MEFTTYNFVIFRLRSSHFDGIVLGRLTKKRLSLKLACYPIDTDMELAHNSAVREFSIGGVWMLLASYILLIIAAILLIYDAILMFTGRPNPIKGWPLPCPVTLIALGLGLLLLSINYFIG